MVKKGINTISEVLESSGCHRLPERSFFYRGKQFPVCARCTGVMIGQTLTFFIALVFFYLYQMNINFYLLIGMMFPFALPMLLDWSIQEYLSVMSNNYRRLVTGFFAGVSLGFLYWIGVFRILEWVVG